MEEVEGYLSDHIQYLENYYTMHKFICSGRKNPRTGGIILCMAIDKEEVQKIISQDPFFVNQIAKYEIIEFIPTKCDEKFESFLPTN